ncbi:MAG: hypothetical protein LBF97_04605 [Elusimicrobiota bacterium]|jgi:hypothetical protein|nr:hypothetical protein [Elusimicrobiota bacterium]
MLNGIDPFFLIELTKKDTLKQVSEMDGTIYAENVIENITTNTRIPIYLHRLIGLYVSTENKGLQISSDTMNDYLKLETMNSVTQLAGTLKTQNKTTTTIKQRPLQNSLDISLIGERNSVILNIFLTLADMIFEKLTSGDYSISYFNQNMLVYRAKLGNFNYNMNADNTLVNISLSLIIEEKDTKSKDDSIISLKNIGDETSPNVTTTPDATQGV